MKNGKKESHNNDVCFLREWNNKKKAKGLKMSVEIESEEEELGLENGETESEEGVLS